jgi:hypothetical protein
VTQQFNTTTSMGRLTLNMLLSFAQFEREVAGERIRDKIAATVKKGVWVCGRPPLGYTRRTRADGGGLEVVPNEARVVRAIFEGYMRSRSLVKLAAQITTLGHASKRWATRTGEPRGGNPFTTAALYRVLTNPVYIGKITHTRRAPGGSVETSVYDGVHRPIIPRELWDRVHASMQRATPAPSHRWTHTHLLKGKLRTSEGFAMSPSTVQRRTISKGQPVQRRIGYYVSQKAIKQGYAACPIKSINAAHLDGLVRGLVLDHAASTGFQWAIEDPSQRDHQVREAIERVIVAPDHLIIHLLPATKDEGGPDTPRTTQAGPRAPVERACRFTPVVEQGRGGGLTLTLNIQMKKLDGRRLLLGPDGQDLLAHGALNGAAEPNAAIISAIGLAYACRRDVVFRGREINVVARELGLSASRVKALLSLTRLGPAVLKAALTGTLPPRTSIKRLLAAARHLDWSRQQALLGLQWERRGAAGTDSTRPN